MAFFDGFVSISLELGELALCAGRCVRTKALVMLITYAVLLFMIPAITGWGYGTIRALRRLNIQSPHRFDVLEPIVGLATLSVLVNLENLIFPVSRVFALLVMAIGWALFLYRVWRIRAFVLKPFWIGLILVWIALVSTHAVSMPANRDSGLYHIPAIRWLVDSATPFGLGNLHGRLAFNSAWFSVSAVLAQSSVGNVQNYTALASEALLAVFGIAIISALYKLTHEKANHLSIIFLLLCGFLGFARLILNDISSPSSDYAVLLLGLMLGYVFLRAVETKDSLGFLYEFWLSVVLTLFLITIKVSVVPFLLIPVSLFLIGYRRRVGLEHVKNLLPVVLTTFVVMGSWMIRGVVLSGCLAYPSSITCIPGLPWTVSRVSADSEARFVQSWARAPGNPDMTEVLSSWDWLGPWFWQSIVQMDFILPLICLGVGFGLSVLLWGRIRERPDLLPVIALAVISFVGMLFWFLSAPSFRFGAAWFWLAGLLALCLPVLSLLTSPSTHLLVRRWIVLVLIASALLVTGKSIFHVQRSQMSLGAVLFGPPPLQAPEAISQTTLEGISINSVAGDDLCYWVPMCMPYFSSDLQVRRTSDQRFIFLSR